MSSTRQPEVWERYFDVPKHQIIFINDELVVFHDRTPKASTHILVVPRHRYIPGVESLTAADFPLLQSMARIGSELSNATTDNMGFHQSPMRSVEHLHLHCVIPPFTTTWHRIAFTPMFGEFIGFKRVSTVLRSLSKQYYGTS